MPTSRIAQGTLVTGATVIGLGLGLAVGGQVEETPLSGVDFIGVSNQTEAMLYFAFVFGAAAWVLGQFM